MNKDYIVEVTDEDGYIYKLYNGNDENEAKKIYKHFLSKKYIIEINLYHVKHMLVSGYSK